MFARTLTALVLFAFTVMDQPRCFGQAFSANLTGLVTDPAGAAVPGITVKVTNTATNEERQTKAGSEGRYSFSQLLPGTYELTAGAPGFQTFVERNITLVANQSAALNAGSNAICSSGPVLNYDATGVPTIRPYGDANCDLGAYEQSAVTPVQLQSFSID